MKYLKITVLGSILALFISSYLFAQTDQDSPDKKISLKLEGMVGASFGRNFYAFNVGGPSFGLKINSNLKIGVGAVPSFYVRNGKSGGKLGVSPRIDYKNFVLIAPFFHFDDPDAWVGSVGFGYKFH
jgi:glutamate synthase domain-containing protein 3